MREIKFRLIKDGKIVGFERHILRKYCNDEPARIVIQQSAIENGEWIDIHYFLLLYNTNHEGFWIPQDDKEQYTGLKDKNGNEGYHHDICRDISGKIFEIVWKNNGWHRKYIEEEVEYTYTVSDFTTDEIIGNIHENGEILEKEKQTK